jgi:hypothetical protein
MSTPTDLWIAVASIAAWIAIVAVVVMFADKAAGARWPHRHRPPRLRPALQPRICFLLRALERISPNCSVPFALMMPRLRKEKAPR